MIDVIYEFEIEPVNCDVAIERELWSIHFPVDPSLENNYKLEPTLFWRYVSWVDASDIFEYVILVIYEFVALPVN